MPVHQFKQPIAPKSIIAKAAPVPVQRTASQAIMQLQQVYGNRAVTQMLAAQQQSARPRPVAQLFGRSFGYSKHTPSGLDPEVQQALPKQQEQVENLIGAIKTKETAAKAKLEQEKREKMIQYEQEYDENLRYLAEDHDWWEKQVLDGTHEKQQLEVTLNQTQLDKAELENKLKLIATAGKQSAPNDQKQRNALQKEIKNLERSITQTTQAITRADNKVKKAQEDIRLNSWDKGVEHYQEQTTNKKRQYQLHTYVDKLRAIGLTKEKFERQLQSIKMSLAPTADAEEFNVVWNGVVVYKIFTGDNAYEEQIKKNAVDPVTGKRVSRAVFAKKGSGKQYVKDDRGVMTRRFAYAEKSAQQIENTVNATPKKPLKGRWDKGLLKKNDALRAEFDFATPGHADMSEEEMLYVHQELGSGYNQRGVSISSTDKELYGNTGDKFKSTGGYTLKIDLARVPEGQKNLYNLYSEKGRSKVNGYNRYNYSKTKSGFTRGSLSKTADQAKNHTDRSTSKNRELFLRELTDDMLESKTKH